MQIKCDSVTNETQKWQNFLQRKTDREKPCSYHVAIYETSTCLMVHKMNHLWHAPVKQFICCDTRPDLFIPRKEMIIRIVITVIESKHNPLEHLIHSTYSTYVSNANRPISFSREERTL